MPPFASIVDTGGKFATGVNDTGGKFANGVNDKWQIATGINNTDGKFATGVNDTGGKQWEQLSYCRRLKMNLKKKNFLYANSTTQNK